MLQMAPSSAGRGPGFAFTNVRFFEHLKFLLQPNKKLLFCKYHSRVRLMNTANTQNRTLSQYLTPESC